jgi:hypothetical protein
MSAFLGVRRVGLDHELVLDGTGKRHTRLLGKAPLARL